MGKGSPVPPRGFPLRLIPSSHHDLPLPQASTIVSRKAVLSLDQGSDPEGTGLGLEACRRRPQQLLPSGVGCKKTTEESTRGSAQRLHPTRWAPWLFRVAKGENEQLGKRSFGREDCRGTDQVILSPDQRMEYCWGLQGQASFRSPQRCLGFSMAAPSHVQGTL